MRRCALLTIACALGALCSCRPGPDMSHEEPASGTPAMLAPAAGVPASLARERAARLMDIRYELHFVIPEVVEVPVRGRAVIRFRLADASRPLALDFAGPASSIRAVRARGASLVPAVAEEHVLLPASALAEGENEIVLDFEASSLPLNRSRDFMYTLFVPARARLAFPCFDQPDLKGRYRLSLDAPAGWEAIANSAVVSRGETADGVRLAFAETAPISTYLFAFAAGRFSIESGERGGRTFRMLHRETDAEKVSRNRDAIFDLHASALQWLEQYTGIPYPFEKFDFLLVPSFQFGGMEHPGSIFYNAEALLLDPSATQNQRLARATLIAHETAHMWFGDLVTMRWFDDVWMKEVFANFMAAKIVNPSFPEVNHDLRFLYAHYPPAYDVERTPGTNAIRQRLDNLNEAGSLYGAIIYQKAPIVMRQLEMIVTPEGLREGLREYLRQYSYGNAGWPDLISVLDRRTADDLAAWSAVWVEQAGRPIVTTSVHVRGSALTLRLAQQDPVPGRDLVWSQRLRTEVNYSEGPRVVPLTLDRQEHVVTVHVGREDPPLFVLPTGGGIGYGDFVLDPRSREYLSGNLHAVDDPLTRGAVLVTLWEEMLGARLRPDVLFDLLLLSVTPERDELTVQRMLACIQQTYWKFLDESERDARSLRLERTLMAGLGAARGESLKAAWFGALRDTARSPATLGWLTRVWNGAERVRGLRLAEPDYMTLALELAVREVPGWDRILEQQRDRIQNPDRRAQFEFVMPALSADLTRRDAFFESLRDVANRRREPWVLQAVSYLHHPLRAAASEQHIDAALQMLHEIQRTGDIFFPKRWMDATLAGHRSGGAAQRVRTFLERLPAGYPERLRRIVLSSADSLFRASGLRAE